MMGEVKAAATNTVWYGAVGLESSWAWGRICNRVFAIWQVVGGSGLEPLTSCVSSKYSNQLS